MSEANPVKILIVGHSYVRRLKEHVDKDITNANMGLKPTECQVVFFGKGGATIYRDRDLLTRYVRTVKPDIVFIHIGENDLRYKAASQLGNTLEEFFLEISGLARLTIVSQLLCFPVNIDRKPEFVGLNSKLAEEFKDLERVVLWKHCAGFWKADSTMFDRYGVHLNDKGMRRYWHSVRYALKKGLCQLRSV